MCKRGVCRLPAVRKGCPDGADDHRPYQSGIAEPDLRLGWMNVHVHTVRRAGDEECNGWKAVGRHHIRVGAPHCSDKLPVPDATTIDEEILHVALSSRPGGQASKAVDLNIFADQTEGNSILHEVVAEDPADPLFLLLTRRDVENPAILRDE